MFHLFQTTDHARLTMGLHPDKYNLSWKIESPNLRMSIAAQNCLQCTQNASFIYSWAKSTIIKPFFIIKGWLSHVIYWLLNRKSLAICEYCLPSQRHGWLGAGDPCRCPTSWDHLTLPAQDKIRFSISSTVSRKQVILPHYHNYKLNHCILGSICTQTCLGYCTKSQLWGTVNIPLIVGKGCSSMARSTGTLGLSQKTLILPLYVTSIRTSIRRTGSKDIAVMCPISIEC